MKRRVTLIALLLVAVAAVAFAFADAIDGATLRRYNSALLDFAATRPVLAPLTFIAVYLSAVVASVPAAALFTVVGGYLFGWVEGTAYTLVAQMVGATALFLLARRALAGWVLRRAGPRARALRDGFARNALSYIIVLRLIGLLPGFLVNAVPGALGVPARTYLLGSALGLIPGSLVYAGIGAGLGSLVESEEALSPRNVLTPEIVLSLVGLIALALLPVVYRKVREHRHAA